jgi:hypothetical protein
MRLAAVALERVIDDRIILLLRAERRAPLRPRVFGKALISTAGTSRQ